LNYIFSTQFINNYYQSSSTSCGLGSLFVWVNEQRCLWRSLRFSPSSSSVFNYFVNIRSQFCGSLLRSSTVLHDLHWFFMTLQLHDLHCSSLDLQWHFMMFTGSSVHWFLYSLALHWFFIVMFTGSSLCSLALQWYFMVFTGYSLDLHNVH